MGHSNEGFAGATSPWAAVWEESRPLPEPGQNEPLDSLCERKHITIGDLARVGARLSPEDFVLWYMYPDAVKARDLITGREWNLHSEDGPSDYKREPKIIPGRKDRAKLVVVEGETDAARMASDEGPGYDVMIQAGAEHVHEAYVEAAKEYEGVLVALDADKAGDSGAAKWQRSLPHAVRWRPPEGSDWCDLAKLPATPEPPKPPPIFVWGEELFELEYPDIPAYFDDRLLPKQGTLIIHGWKNSYKSWLGFDMVAALATGSRWAKFETTEAEARVLVMQFEVPPFAYAERMQMLLRGIPRDLQPLFRNVAHYSPLELQSMDITQEKWRDHVLDVVDKADPDVVYFDPIRQMVGLNSMNEQDVQQHLTQLFRGLNRMGKAVIFVHHDSKTGARRGGGSLLDMTAADVLVGAADSAVSVQLPKGDDLEQSQRRNLRYVVRSAPPVAPSGFEMRDDDLHYQDEPWDGAGEDEQPDEVIELG